MPLDDDASDPEAEEVAYHEAGHATAAVLCVAGRTQMQGNLDRDPGTEFFNGMDNGWTAYLAEHYTDTTEELAKQLARQPQVRSRVHPEELYEAED